MTATKLRAVGQGVGGGRPKIILTEEQKKELPELAAYLTCEQIADRFGMDRATFFELKKRDSEVNRLYQRGRVDKIIRYSKMLEAKASGEDPSIDTTAVIFFLKTKARWSEKTEKTVEPITLQTDEPLNETQLRVQLITNILARPDNSVDDVLKVVRLLSSSILDGKEDVPELTDQEKYDYTMAYLEKIKRSTN